MSFGIISFLKSATANRGAAPVADDNPLPVVQTLQAASSMQSSRVMSAATTNGTSVKASPGQVYSINLGNGGTVAALKLYNKASAPVVGTDIPIATYLLPASGSLTINFPTGKVFSLGIAYGITGAAADSDTTAVTLNQIMGAIEYV